MTLSNTSILYCVELALYLLISPLALFLAYRHGRHTTLGYFYLILSIGVRIAADIAQLADKSSSNIPSLATAILSSIGLSPLLLAMSGSILQASTTTSLGRRKKTARWLIFTQIQIHALCAIGVTLLIVGFVHLAEAKSTSDANAADKLRSAGTVLLAVTWLGLVQYAIWLSYRYIQGHSKSSRSTLGLRNSILIALFFGGAKMVYAVVYTFNRTDPAINPITGSLPVTVVLVVGTQLFAVVAMAVGGWMSLGISQEHQMVRPED